jgi:hypothetical protein
MKQRNPKPIGCITTMIGVVRAKKFRLTNADKAMVVIAYVRTAKN